MQELGLHDIQVRVNDSVKFANPHADNYDTVFNAMVEANGYNRAYGEEEKTNFIAAMIITFGRK